MLERLDCIRKVGLFYDYKHVPGCEFGQVTLVYGDNGVGKSTLAAILDSLRESNGAEVVRRRSLPGNEAPVVSVIAAGKPYVFDGQNWDCELPHETLEVFCPGFVARNVHAAASVEPDHRRNLCEFVLGRSAIASLKRLTEADNEAREALASKKKLEEEIRLLVKGPDTLETFLTLATDPDIDAKLDEARAHVKLVENREAFISRVAPTVVPLPEMGSAALIDLLETGASHLDGDAAHVVQEHVTRRLDSDGEKWLAYGAKHTDPGDACPFCAQSLDDSALAQAVLAYFSAEYQDYTSSLSTRIAELQGQLSFQAFLQVRAALAGQAVIAAQWADVHPFDQISFEAGLAEAESSWKQALLDLAALLARKQEAPLRPIQASLAETTLTHYEQARRKLSELNARLGAAEAAATAKKETLSEADLAQASERVSRLENQKTRFEPLAQDLVGRFSILAERRSTLEREKGNLKKTIDEHAARVVGKYQSGINDYLNFFESDIRIEAVESRFPSGRAIIQYALKAQGYEIPLGCSEDQPCFETVLSEGDKNLLALSFFLARLKDHLRLDGRTVVFDDPVNSLGSGRRILVEEVIRELRGRGAQVIVLTHDERLAALMHRDRGFRDMVCLQVERSRSGSGLCPWDIERATRSQYVTDYLTLADYVNQGGDHTKAAGRIRPYVEQRLRHLYPGPPFTTRDSLGEMIRTIRESKPGSRVHALRDKLPELEVINKAALPSHHATDDVSGMSPLTPDSVRIFAEKALSVL